MVIILIGFAQMSGDISCSKCSHRKKYHQFISGSNDHRCFYL